MSLNRHAGLVSASNVISNEIPPPTEPVLKTCSFKIKAPNSKFQIPKIIPQSSLFYCFKVTETTALICKTLKKHEILPKINRGGLTLNFIRTSLIF